MQPLKSAVDPGDYDADLMETRLTLINCTVTSTSGSLPVVVKDGSQVLGTNTFSWTRTGNIIYASNPNAINNWLDQFAGTGGEVSFDVEDIDLNAGPGFGQAVANLWYGSEHLGTSSSSWQNGGGIPD